MLVLSRKIGETIEIAAGEIVIKVMSIRGNTVRLAIGAPKDIDIVRPETKLQTKLQTKTIQEQN